MRPFVFAFAQPFTADSVPVDVREVLRRDLRVEVRRRVVEKTLIERKARPIEDRVGDLHRRRRVERREKADQRLVAGVDRRQRGAAEPQRRAHLVEGRSDAPFIVMPSANEALSGDTNTFESRCAALIVFQSANENSFDAPSTLCSADDSGRGSAVRAGRRLDCAGSRVPPEQPARRTAVTTAPSASTRCFVIAHSLFESPRSRGMPTRSTGRRADWSSESPAWLDGWCVG